MLNKYTFMLALFLFALLSWWFRYDTYCNTERHCIAYDRYTGQWIFPHKIALDQSNERIVQQLIAYSKSKMDYKKALTYGYSYQEIIDGLREKDE